MELDFRRRARDLRNALNDPRADLATLADEAAELFGAANLATRVHWLDLERDGYTSSIEARALADVLGLPADDPLIAEVKSYRVQTGWPLGVEPTGVTFPHFFVEPIADLVAARTRVRAVTSTARVRLDFATDTPSAGEFDVDVFDRILLGLRAALHLQLSPLARAR